MNGLRTDASKSKRVSEVNSSFQPLGRFKTFYSLLAEIEEARENAPDRNCRSPATKV